MSSNFDKAIGEEQQHFERRKDGNTVFGYNTKKKSYHSQ